MFNMASLSSTEVLTGLTPISASRYGSCYFVN
jgi:hypothetical protein